MSANLYFPAGDGLTGTLDDRTYFTSACKLDHKYYLKGYFGFYFIVRKDRRYADLMLERVCLYEEGVINEYLRGNAEPYDCWLSNELRYKRDLDILHRDMEQKIWAIVNNRKNLHL